LHYLCDSLAQPSISVDAEPKFQALAPPSKSFWLRLQPHKIAPAAGSGSGSLALLRILGLIHISPSYWIIYRSFEIILEMETLHWIGIQIQCSMQIQKHSVRYEVCFKKYLVAEGSSGSNGWARVKRERTKSRERLLRTILFYLDHLQHKRERPDMQRKHMNSDKVQRKEPKLTTSWSGTVGGGTNVQEKQHSTT